MNEETKRAILDKIKAYDRIIISRHIRPDGDAVGSTLGLRRILKLTFPEKEIYAVGDDHTDYVSFLGDEDEQLPDDKYDGALLVILDCATLSRVSNSKANLAKEIVKIDHHVDVAPYGDISWVEDFRSSCCEMIVDFYMTFRNELLMDKEAANCIYTGMVTDSGRFQYDGTTGDTMRCAAELLDCGIDTDTLFARLYLEDYDYLKSQAKLFDKVKMTENGVAYLIVDKRMQKAFNMTREQASNIVSIMSDIKGCIVWIAFIDNGDGTIRVRLRSRFVAVNKLGEKYEGGGHACAAGATVHNRKEIKALLADADQIVHDYKINNFYL